MASDKRGGKQPGGQKSGRPLPTGMAAPNRYAEPERPRITLLETAGPNLGVAIRAIEVVQAVQDLAHSVPLIAGRQTIVRVYVDPASLSGAGQVTAEIAWSQSGAEAYLPAANAVPLDPGGPATLQQHREDAALSINFQLPSEAVAAGTLTLRVSRLFQPGGEDLPVEDAAPLTVRFVSAPPLRIRVIGLRYRRGTRTFAPAAVHFSYLRSYLGRAYPTASVEWSQIVVDADFSAPFDNGTVDAANMQIAAIRNREVNAGVDRRTHYYGMVDDNAGRNFMRGKAFAIPSSAQPDTVASGPAGVPRGFSGDFDASYADWYGAHELGHTFGRYHPGFPSGAQDASDAHFPYPDGCISDVGDEFVGFDVGDPALGIPMAALPGRACHDIMTYADRQWISAYTFSAILARLIEEDSL